MNDALSRAGIMFGAVARLPLAPALLLALNDLIF